MAVFSQILRKSTSSKPEPLPQIYTHSYTNDDLINRLPPLKQGFQPTSWLSNPHLQILWMETTRNRWGYLNKYDFREQLVMSDGGITALAWMGYHLPEQVPTIVLFHTITGTPEGLRRTASDLHELTGWRVVICVRRGHDNLPLPLPKLNILGCAEDATAQVNYIQQKFPASPLYALGISAGSGLMIRYLAQKNAAPFQAAFAYAPGYNTDVAFDRVHGLYAQLLCKRLFAYFIEPHLGQFSHFKTLDTLKQARTVSQLNQAMYEISGFNDFDTYARVCNPMHVFQNLSQPMMILSAEDDLLCRIENVKPYIQEIIEKPNLILVTTSKGGHCGHFEGERTPRSWANQLIASYFLAQADISVKSRKSKTDTNKGQAA